MITYKDEDFQKYNKEQKNYYLNYIDSGFINASINWIHKRRFLERYELIYVIEGELFIKLDGENLIIEEGSVIIVPPFKTLTGARTSTRKTSFYWVDFMTDAPDVFDIVILEIQEIRMPGFREIFDKLTISANLRDCHKFIYDSYLIMIFDELNNNRDRNSSKKLLALKISSFIEENISKPLTAQYIADELNYNKDYLCRIVRQYYGVPLKDHINRLKMNLAKRLLITSDYSVKDIADFLGYDDSNLFTKYFKYHMKISPLEYRRSN